MSPMPLQPKCLLLFAIAGMLVAMLGVRAGGPIWLLHLGVGFFTLVCVVGYDRWYERNRSQ